VPAQAKTSVSIALTETSAGWTLHIVTSRSASRRELSDLDGAIAEVTVSPNLVPGVPFAAELSLDVATP
jgi:hypothetical protein